MAEKLIIGFERDELEKNKGGTWCDFKEADEGFDFCTWFEFGLQYNPSWLWPCRPLDCPQGEMALVRPLKPCGGEPIKFQPTPYLSRYYPALRQGAEAREVLNTYQWLARTEADLRDWSGFDLLRMDLRALTEGQAKIWVMIEDEELEPPVTCYYLVDPGKWVTLEVDLARAVKERGLDLARMVNIYVFAGVSSESHIHLDNVRVATKDVAADLPVLKDERPMAFSIELPPKPELPAAPKNAERNSAPLKLEKYENVVSGSIVPLGWIAAYDNDRLFLAYTDRCYEEQRNRTGGRAVFTLDGGKTWQPAANPTVRNLDHGTARGNAIDVNGDSIVLSSGPGCAGLGRPTPRQHCNKYTFTGDGWELREPVTIADCDVRHCGSNAFMLRLPSGPHAGRIWTAWGTCTRLRTLAIHAKFSDDDGKTWHSWREGKSALVPGSTYWLPGEEEPNWRMNTYAYQQPRLAVFGKHVAVIFQDVRGLRWSRFDGKNWTPVEDIDSSAAVLEINPYEMFRVPGSCVTRGTNEVFLTAWNIPGVLRWNGKSWRRECADAPDAGMLTLCANGEIMLITSGHVPEPSHLKIPEITRRASVLCYRKSPKGKWAKPLDLTGGPVVLHEYRQMAGVSVPLYSPANFAPVAWTDGQTVTVVKVPTR